MVQETTFNSAYQADGSDNILSVHQWLDALYSEASLKKIDESQFNYLVSTLQSLHTLEEKIQYGFSDRNLLAQAFMQSTFCYEMKSLAVYSNERLEFLGDSLLNLFVGEILFEKYPDKNEGELSKLRGSLVNEAMLAKLALCLNLEDNLFLGKGEYKNHGHLKESILADAFEAFLAAVYIDSGSDHGVAKKSFRNMISLYEKKSGTEFFSDSSIEDFDSKTKLQELSVAKRGVFPVYKSEASGELFTVEVWIADMMVASMTGPSKKKCEKELARKILEENLY